ncbi:efflux RND transporter permease subunit [Escherichia coli]
MDATAQSIEAVAKTVPGVVSALAERLEGGRYIDIDINREKASRYGMTVGDVQLFISSAIGGATVGETVEARPGTRLISAIRRITGTARRL